MGRWSEIRNQEDYQRAKKLARGCYQRNLLAGVEAYSGSTLRGKAKKYGMHYRWSRDNLLERLSKAGINWHIKTAQRGRLVLVIGSE